MGLSGHRSLRQHQGLGLGQRPPPLRRARVGERVEATPHAVRGRYRALALGRQQPLAVGAKDRFQRGGVELAQEVAHGEAGARFPRPKTAMTEILALARRKPRHLSGGG
jgi:hypothetical protein